MLRHHRWFTGVGGGWENPGECPCHPRKITVFLFTIVSGDGKTLSWSKFPINRETSKPLPAINLKMIYTTQMVVLKDVAECFSIIEEF